MLGSGKMHATHLQASVHVHDEMTLHVIGLVTLAEANADSSSRAARELQQGAELQSFLEHRDVQWQAQEPACSRV